MSWSLVESIAVHYHLWPALQFSAAHINMFPLLAFLAAIHRNSPRPVKVPRCHSDPPNPHLIIPTPEGFRYLGVLRHGLVCCACSCLASAGCLLGCGVFPSNCRTLPEALLCVFLRTHHSAEERQIHTFEDDTLAPCSCVASSY